MYIYVHIYIENLPLLQNYLISISTLKYRPQPKEEEEEKGQQQQANGELHKNAPKTSHNP